MPFDYSNYERQPTSTKWWNLLKKKKKIGYSTNEDYLEVLNVEWDNLMHGTGAYHKRHIENEIAYSNTIDVDFVTDQDDDKPEYRVSYNISRSNCNAAANKISKVKPKTTFVTKNQPHRKQQIAKEADNWIQHIFKKGMIYAAGKKCFMSAAIGQAGHVKVIKKSNGVFKFIGLDTTQMVIANPSLEFNESDEKGDFYHIPLYKLFEKYPETKKYYDDERGLDLNTIIEVRHIYKAYKAKVIFTEHFVIELDKWDCKPPYEKFVWSELTRGYFTDGIVDELKDFQKRIQFMLDRISDNTERVSNTRVYVSAESGISEEMITGESGGTVIRYNGTIVPVVDTPAILSQQHFMHLEDLYQKAHRQIGMSDFISTGRLPPGFDQTSGVALRTMNDMESERYINIKTRYEEMFVNLAKLVCQMSTNSDLPENLKEINLKEELKNIQVYPTNILPETPSGMLATAFDMANSGLISTDEILSMIDSPDVKKLVSSKTARREAVDILIDRSLEKKEPIDIDAILGEEVFLDRLRNRYAILLKDNVDEKYEDELDLLSEAASKIVASLEAKARQARLEEIQAAQQIKAPPPEDV